ncbi:DsbA family protein, partial [Achromobacter ruhlandii]
RAVLRGQGLDAEALMAAAEQPAAHQAYRDNTDAAVAAGVFGSPSYMYRGELFWGQDRLDMLEEAIARPA